MCKAPTNIHYYWLSSIIIRFERVQIIHDSFFRLTTWIIVVSINLLAFYHKYCSLIGYAKLLWPPHTSTKTINFFLFLLLFYYFIPVSHIYNVNTISKCQINKTEIELNYLFCCQIVSKVSSLTVCGWQQNGGHAFSKSLKRILDKY